jgi:hypothetical protein
MTSTKTTLYSYIILSVLLILILVYGVVDIRKKSAKTLSVQREVDALAQNDTLAQSIKMLKTNSKEDLDYLDTLALDNDKLVPFIEFIESTGREMGLTISIASVTVDKVSPSSTSKLPPKVHVTVETEGSWASNIGFLHALEHLPTQIFIDTTTLQTTFSNQENPGSKKVWQMGTVLTLYSFK